MLLCPIDIRIANGTRWDPPAKRNFYRRCRIKAYYIFNVGLAHIVETAYQGSIDNSR